MKEIKLTHEKVTLVDDEDFEYLNQWKWRASKNKKSKTYYAQRDICIDNKRTTVFMHRIIMNPNKHMLIDHIDMNGLNNLKTNLRICNHSQNQCNRKSWGLSKYLGVSIKKKRSIIYYQTLIKVNKKSLYIGIFKSEIEAAKAYDKAAKEYHGEYANLNFK